MMVKRSMVLMSVISMGLSLGTAANASSKQSKIWEYAVYNYATHMKIQLKEEEKENKERQRRIARAQARRTNQQAQSHHIKHDISKVHGPLTFH